MKIYGAGHKVADIIFDNPAAIPVLNRFGIRLGVGSETISSCCQRLGLNEAFVEAILNISLNEDYMPERVLKSFSLAQLTDYLLHTDGYYKDVQLPNISRHLDSLIRRSGNDGGNLGLLRKFFDDLSEELNLRARRELEEGRCNEDDWQSVSDCISDLLSFFVIHLRGNYDENLCNAVVNAIFTLDQDLKRTTRIRRRALLPLLGNDGR